MAFNFWETSIGKDLDQKSTEIEKWMKGMILLSFITTILTAIITFRKK
jgi:hypothetical protein